MNSVFSRDHSVKLQENENIDKYLDLTKKAK